MANKLEMVVIFLHWWCDLWSWNGHSFIIFMVWGIIHLQHWMCDYWFWNMQFCNNCGVASHIVIFGITFKIGDVANGLGICIVL